MSAETPEMGIIGTAADYDQAEMLDYEQRRNTQLEEECGALREEKAELLAALNEVGTILRQRHQEGWESRLLGVVDTAIAKARGKK